MKIYTGMTHSSTPIKPLTPPPSPGAILISLRSERFYGGPFRLKKLNWWRATEFFLLIDALHRFRAPGPNATPPPGSGPDHAPLAGSEEGK